MAPWPCEAGSTRGHGSSSATSGALPTRTNCLSAAGFSAPTKKASHGSKPSHREK
jgi:hypothetical protein